MASDLQRVDEMLLDETLEAYVVDTVAIAFHITNKLPRAAGKIFERAEKGEVILFVPEAALGEFVYLTRKGKLHVEDQERVIREFLDFCYLDNYMIPITLDILAWRILLTLNVPELHDCMISACAQSRDLPIITNDPEIQAESRLTTIWK